MNLEKQTVCSLESLESRVNIGSVVLKEKLSVDPLSIYSLKADRLLRLTVSSHVSGIPRPIYDLTSHVLWPVSLF